MINTIVIKSWHDILQFVETRFKDYTKTILLSPAQYRGQSNLDWDLAPSLLRIVKGDAKSEAKAHFYEKQAEMEFISQIHLLSSTTQYTSESGRAAMYIDMQHYSCPTRLLDWSSSPYVALYFAVFENFNIDGALFTWISFPYNTKMKELHPNMLPKSSNDLLDLTDFDFIQYVLPIRKNERIVRQQATFTVSNNILKDHATLIDENFSSKENSGLYKLVIPKSLKLEFLARLKSMNITAESLFPGLDGFGKSIKEALLLRKWGNH